MSVINVYLGISCYVNHFAVISIERFSSKFHVQAVITGALTHGYEGTAEPQRWRPSAL